MKQENIERKEKIKNVIKKIVKIIVYIFSAIGFITTLLVSCSAIMSKNDEQQKESNNKPIQSLNINDLPSNDHFAKGNELVLTIDKRQRLRNNILGGYTYEVLFGQYHTDLYRTSTEILAILGGYSDIDFSVSAFFSDSLNLVCDFRLTIVDNVNSTSTYIDYVDIVQTWKENNTLYLKDINNNIQNYVFPLSGHQYGLDLLVKEGNKTFGLPYTGFFKYMSVKVDKYQWVNSTKVWQSVEIVEQLNAGFYLDTFLPKEDLINTSFHIRYLNYIGIGTNSDGTITFVDNNFNNVVKTPVSLIDNQYYHYNNLPNITNANIVMPSNIVCGTLGFIIVGEYMYMQVDGINVYSGFFNVDYDKIFTNSQNYYEYTTNNDIGPYLDNCVLKEYEYYNYNNYYTNNDNIIYYDNDLYINCAKVNYNNSIYKLIEIKIIRNDGSDIIDFERKYLIVDNNYYYVDGANYLFSELLSYPVATLPDFNINFYKVNYQTVQLESFSSYDGTFILRYLSVNDGALIDMDNNNDNGVIPPNNGGGNGNNNSGDILDFFNVLTYAFGSITPLFNVIILPNITLGFLLFFPLMITLLIFIINLFKR